MNRFKTAVLLSYVSLASASAALITPALPIIQKSWDLSNSSLQLIISIFLLGYLLGQWIYGPLANRFGRLSALRLGFVVINIVGIVISGIAAFFDSYLGLIFGRFITALGASSGLVCTFILMNELFEKNKAKSLFAFVVCPSGKAA